MSSRTVPVLLAALVCISAMPLRAQDDVALERRGRPLLTDNCSRCHAIGRTGNSPHREVPLFRTLGQRYPIETLAETLAEGLYTGHPDMPEFVFEIRDVSAILAYLQSIQEPGIAPRSGRTAK
jgi:cytochrome c